VYQLRHTAGLNPKAFQGRYTRAGPTYGAGFTAVKPLKPLDNWLLQVGKFACSTTKLWSLSGAMGCSSLRPCRMLFPADLCRWLSAYNQLTVHS
jgi:hypothetical protein